VLGWDINFSILISSITVAIYVTLGGLRSRNFQRSASIHLDLGGSLLIPCWDSWKLAAEQPEGPDRNQCIRGVHAPMEHLGSFRDNPMGIHWTGIVFGLGMVISFGYWTTDFLVVQRVLSAKDLRAAKMAPIIGAAFKNVLPFIVILPGLLAIAVLPVKLTGEGTADSYGRAQLQ